MKDIGVNAQFFSVLMDDERIKGSDGAFEGTIAITSFTPTEKFITKFKQKYNEEADMGSDTAYDAAMLLAKAMKGTGSTDVDILKDYLNDLETYDGASGHLTFDGKGGVTKTPSFKIVKNGKLVDLE